LTGRAPFQAASPMDTILQVLEQEPASPRKLNPLTPPDLETICQKCLEKSQLRRYHSAKELAEELGRFLAHEPIQARPVSWVRRTWSWARRRPWVMAGLASVGMLSLLGVSYWLWAENDYLRYKLEHPDHVRRPGPRAAQELSLSYIALYSMLVLVVIREWFGNRLASSKVAGVAARHGLLVAAALTGVSAALLSLYALFKAVDTLVWVREEVWHHVLLYCGVFWTGVLFCWDAARAYEFHEFGSPHRRPVDLSEDEQREINELLIRGASNWAVIKLYRKYTGADFKEASAAVPKMLDALRQQHPNLVPQLGLIRASVAVVIASLTISWTTLMLKATDWWIGYSGRAGWLTNLIRALIPLTLAASLAIALFARRYLFTARYVRCQVVFGLSVIFSIAALLIDRSESWPALFVMSAAGLALGYILGRMALDPDFDE